MVRLFGLIVAGGLILGHVSEANAQLSINLGGGYGRPGISIGQPYGYGYGGHGYNNYGYNSYGYNSYGYGGTYAGNYGYNPYGAVGYPAYTPPVTYYGRGYSGGAAYVPYGGYARPNYGYGSASPYYSRGFQTYGYGVRRFR